MKGWALLGLAAVVVLAVAIVAASRLSASSAGQSEALRVRWEAAIAQPATLASYQEGGFFQMEDARARHDAEGASALANSERAWVDAQHFPPCLLVAAAAYHEAMVALGHYATAVEAYLDSGKFTGPGGGAKWWAADQAQKLWEAKRDLVYGRLEFAPCP
jgi:hypothetical protein